MLCGLINHAASGFLDGALKVDVRPPNGGLPRGAEAFNGIAQAGKTERILKRRRTGEAASGAPARQRASATTDRTSSSRVGSRLRIASSAFVPTDSMPDWLQAFAENQPFTIVMNAVRALFLDMPVGNLVWLTILWMGGILVVMIPLATRQYRRRTG